MVEVVVRALRPLTFGGRPWKRLERYGQLKIEALQMAIEIDSVPV